MGRSSNDGVMELITYVIFAIFAMPIVGLVLLLGDGSASKKVLGMVLLIIGVILWSKM